MRWLFAATLTIASFSAFAWFYFRNAKSKHINHPAKILLHKDKHEEELNRLKSFGNSIKTYTLKGNYNSRYCFLVDMKQPSGNNRFFIYDMQNEVVMREGLVAHGSGSDFGNNGLHFSNTPSSNCTSLGKYRIGKQYNGTFGLAYKLHGLDTSNSNAFNRFVVLHAHSCVPDKEITGQEICKSWGCPTVSPAFLQELKSYLDKTEKPILLWIFN